MAVGIFAKPLPAVHEAVIFRCVTRTDHIVVGAACAKIKRADLCKGIAVLICPVAIDLIWLITADKGL